MSSKSNATLSPAKRKRARPRILLAITGSVAAVKGPEIAYRLVNELECDVKILLTRGGENFWFKARDYNSYFWAVLQILLQDSAEENDSRISMVYANDEWKEWKRLGDPVLHIDLRDWADVLLLAPLSAHTLAKISNGFCDDTVSCVVRAWDFGYGPRPGKPMLLAPAMNTAMWEHPLTQNQLKTVQGFWNTSGNDNESSNNNKVKIIAPQVKKLACGDIGIGALALVDDILKAVEDANNKKSLMQILKAANQCGDR